MTVDSHTHISTEPNIKNSYGTLQVRYYMYTAVYTGEMRKHAIN